jgi:hypothetical protein
MDWDKDKRRERRSTDSSPWRPWQRHRGGGRGTGTGTRIISAWRGGEGGRPTTRLGDHSSAHNQGALHLPARTGRVSPLSYATRRVPARSNRPVQTGPVESGPVESGRPPAMGAEAAPWQLESRAPAAAIVAPGNIGERVAGPGRARPGRAGSGRMSISADGGLWASVAWRGGGRPPGQLAGLSQPVPVTDDGGLDQGLTDQSARGPPLCTARLCVPMT